jgi:hypothetical protein
MALSDIKRFQQPHEQEYQDRKQKIVAQPKSADPRFSGKRASLECANLLALWYQSGAKAPHSKDAPESNLLDLPHRRAMRC